MRIGKARVLITVLASLLFSTAAAGQYNVTADWSDTANPNGFWSYWVGDSLGQLGTRRGDPFPYPPGPPPIWTLGEGDSSYYGWSRSNGSEQLNGKGWDLQAGDVYGHTRGVLQTMWQSPHDGPVEVSGGVWPIRDVGRKNNWEVWLNDTLLLKGCVFSRDPFDRAHPARIALILDVEVGDLLVFKAWPSGIGDYIALDLTIDPAIEVEIDVRPGDDSNPIYLRSRPGLLPVAILGRAGFDVAAIDPSTLRLQDLLVVRQLSSDEWLCSIEDVNADGYSDLVCYFADDPTAWAEEMTTVTLTGNLWGGTAIEGSDDIQIIP